MRQSVSPINVKTRSSSEFSGDVDGEQLLVKYKLPILIGLGVLLVGTILAGFISSHLKNSKEAQGKLLYSFEQSDFKNYLDGKTTGEETEAKYITLLSANKGGKGIISVALPLADKLHEKGETKRAVNILTETEKSIGTKDKMAAFLLNNRLATFNEDLGNIDEAIKRLELIVSSKTTVLESKTYLDLGRLYLQQGKNEEAKKSLQYVVDNFAGEDTSRIAKIYMEKIK